MDSGRPPLTPELQTATEEQPDLDGHGGQDDSVAAIGQKCL